MNYEKVVRRPCGGRVKITVRFCEWEREDKFKTSVGFCEKGKRSFKDITDTNSWSFRNLSMDERAAKELQEQVDFVGDTLLLEAKIEMWQTMKPK